MKHTYPDTHINYPWASYIKAYARVRHLSPPEPQNTTLGYQFHPITNYLLNLRYLPQIEPQNELNDKEQSGHCSAPLPDARPRLTQHSSPG